MTTAIDDDGDNNILAATATIVVYDTMLFDCYKQVNSHQTPEILAPSMSVEF